MRRDLYYKALEERTKEKELAKREDIAEDFFEPEEVEIELEIEEYEEDDDGPIRRWFKSSV